MSQSESVNEAETRAELIDPALAAAGWGVVEGSRYTEGDFNRIIEIKAREAKRVEIFMGQIDQREKTLVFCATQDHALAVRDLVNQMKTSKDPDYCQRVTADDGKLGDQSLRDFQDNEKTIPTILTTSQKLSTGVDALADLGRPEDIGRAFSGFQRFLYEARRAA